MPIAKTDKTLKFCILISFFWQKTVKKTSFFLFLKNVSHFVNYAYILKFWVRAIAKITLNLKLFVFFVTDGPPPRFHQQYLLSLTSFMSIIIIAT